MELIYIKNAKIRWTNSFLLYYRYILEFLCYNEYPLLEKLAVLNMDDTVQVIWVCILCRKKQELLSKTGQWINKSMTSGDSAVMRRIQADMSLVDKRPKLERAHSAAEKENTPLSRSAARDSLRRQYSTSEAQEREEELR